MMEATRTDALNYGIKIIYENDTRALSHKGRGGQTPLVVEVKHEHIRTSCKGSNRNVL